MIFCLGALRKQALLTATMAVVHNYLGRGALLNSQCLQHALNGKLKLLK